MTALLTDEEIIERWKLACLCGGVSAITTAKMVRNFYEAREKLWRELASMMILPSILGNDPISTFRIYELRTALGIDKGGA